MNPSYQYLNRTNNKSTVGPSSDFVSPVRPTEPNAQKKPQQNNWKPTPAPVRQNFSSRPAAPVSQAPAPPAKVVAPAQRGVSAYKVFNNQNASSNRPAVVNQQAARQHHEQATFGDGECVLTILYCFIAVVSGLNSMMIDQSHNSVVEIFKR
jgi:hypothetical protein